MKKLREFETPQEAYDFVRCQSKPKNCFQKSRIRGDDVIFEVWEK